MKTLLFNPFERIAGFTALFTGLGIMLITAVIACLSQIRLDGVLDLHIQNNFMPSPAPVLPFYVYLGEGLINWLSISILLYVSGLIFSKSKFRFVDVFGTQALARFPYLLATVCSWIFFSDNMMLYLEHIALQKGEAVSLSAWDVVQFVLSTVSMIGCFIWMIVLMYRAYRISCNINGSKGVVSFAAALILAEVASKLLIHYFL